LTINPLQYPTKEGDYVNIFVSDADLVYSAYITVTTGGKVLDTFTIVSKPSTFRAPTPPPAGSYQIGYDVANQKITLTANYTDYNGNKSTVSKDIFIQDVDRPGGITFSEWVGSAIAGSKDATIITASVTDPDGNPTSATYTFSRAGVVLQQGPSASFTAGYERAGQFIDVVADYVDGQGHRSSVSGLTILGNPRSVSSPASTASVAPVLGGTVIEGQPGLPDRLVGSSGSDTVSYANSASRVVIDLNAQLTWDGTANDTLVSIESAIGSRFNDDLLGDAGNNVLDGGIGGADLINGLGGIDTVSYVSSTSRVVIDLNAQLTWDGTDNDRLVSIENAIGSRFDDTLIGDRGDNLLTGGGGSDTFLFLGTSGRDTITDFQAGTGAGADVIAYGRGLFVGDDPLRNAVQSGTDVILSTIGSPGGNGSITLLGVTLGDLTASNFRFS
jgi:hypothetical protein